MKGNNSCLHNRNRMVRSNRETVPSTAMAFAMTPTITRRLASTKRRCNLGLLLPSYCLPFCMNSFDSEFFVRRGEVVKVIVVLKQTVLYFLNIQKKQIYYFLNSLYILLFITININRHKTQQIQDTHKTGSSHSFHTQQSFYFPNAKYTFYYISSLFVINNCIPKHVLFSALPLYLTAALNSS